MDPLIDAPSGDDRDFRPEPRDLMVVVMDHVKDKGTYFEEKGPGDIETDSWALRIASDDGMSVYTLTHRIEGEFDDHLIVEGITDGMNEPATILHVHDNTFNGVRFLKGDVGNLGEVYELVKPRIIAEGGTI